MTILPVAHQRLLSLMLLSGALASIWTPVTFADPPTVGSNNVAVADPLIPAPYTTPCTVTLFTNQQFADFNAKPFSYAPPSACPGPWQKVVLSADYSVTMGRQFDRTAEIWLGGAIIYFGTTEEPSASLGQSWHIERDLTDYSPLFATSQSGHADLGNFVGTSGGVNYTGILYGTATLSFYPLAPTVFDHPPRPDALLPLSASADGSTADLASPSAQLSITFSSLPTNIERAFLDVYAQSQASDEFWYTCVPDDVANALQSCGGTGFRETQISIDGQPAGVAPVYPWIYTGGIDPYLWRPIPGVQTLAFEPYRVDLTPFAGVLDDGAAHTIALSVFNTQDHFSTAANLLLYLDHGATQVTGTVTSNTLAAAPVPDVVENLALQGADTNGTVTVTSNRQFAIAGSVTTSHGVVSTQVQQTLGFSNAQTFAISDVLYSQHITQGTTIDSTTTVTAGATVAITHEQRSYPLTVNIDYRVLSDGSANQATVIDQDFSQSVSVGNQGFAARNASLDNHVVTSDTLLISASNQVTGTFDQGTTQTYAYADPFGVCYSRQIQAASGELTAVADGQSCPGGTNTLSWFDAFANYGSSVTGATLQLLP
ncbi:MAG: peptide-N(4)-(N-acetyl-beta-glucosaminyl)asparagine amidase [Rudaea sp.]|nr:peptide-N(4)-(N-acetyl-beta-glucosaminyl)asparagine amidase [Rudaea sp.]